MLPDSQERLYEQERSAIDERLGKRIWLDEEIPVEVGFGKFGVWRVIHGQGGTYIKQNGLANAGRMINEEFVSDTGSTVMSADIKGLVGISEAIHDGNAVLGHVALGVGLCVIGGLGRSSVTAKIHDNNGAMGSQLGSDKMPDKMRLRISMEQERGEGSDDDESDDWMPEMEMGGEDCV